jgi:hypothetical protein
VAPLTRWERAIAASLVVLLALAVPVAVRPSLLVGGADREQAVRRLLDQRARAVLASDREAFLATVDPRDPVLRRGQLAFFESTKDLPLSLWRYDLAARERPGAGRTWAPGLTLRFAFAGFDTLPVTQEHPLSFVRRDDRWYVAGHHQPPRVRQLWDGGPVQVHRGRACLVLAHPAGSRLARGVLATCERAVPHVTRVWGKAWSQRVVVQVPDSAAELSSLVPVAGDLRQIAAVATSELQSGPGGLPRSSADRVQINPEAFATLSASGREVVMRHEITHVASRSVTGTSTPEWLIEGVADYVGYLGSGIPDAVSAQELRADVRDGRLPADLPSDADFTGTRADLPQIYEQSWLAVSLIANRFGRAALLRLYRAAAITGLDEALRTELSIGTAELTAAWRDDLRRRFR